MIYLKNTFFILSLLFLFSSCEDPLKIEDTLQSKIINPPEYLIAINLTYNSVELIWPAYSAKDFDRYEIYCKGNLWPYQIYNVVKDPNIFQFPVNGLNPGWYYNFFVRIVTKDGRNADSKEILVQTYSMNPSPIKDFIYTKELYFSGKSYKYNDKLTWDIYKEAHIIPFSKYVIYFYNENDKYNICVYDSITQISNNFINLNFSNLIENSGYYFYVRTYNSLNKYAESNILYITTPFAMPKTVSLQESTTITENSALLSWTKSDCNSFDHYEVHCLDSIFIPDVVNIENTRITEIMPKENISYLITGLDKNKEYIFRILVFNKSELFSYSNWIGITTTKDGGPVPVTLTEPNTSDITSNSVIIRWTPSRAKFFKSYQIYKSTVPGQSISGMEQVDIIVEQEITNYKITGLKPNTTYYINIPVYNMFGRYTESNTITFTTKVN